MRTLALSLKKYMMVYLVKNFVCIKETVKFITRQGQMIQIHVTTEILDGCQDPHLQILIGLDTLIQIVHLVMLGKLQERNHGTN